MSNRLDAKVIVREGRFEDIIAIKDSLERALMERDRDLPPPEYPYALQQIFEQMGRGMVWVAAKGEEIVGVLILNTYTWPWNRQHVYLENEHLWVEPKHRRGGVASKLIDFAVAFAKLKGMPFQPRITYGSSNTALIDRWMRSKGFEYVGGNFAPRS
jgi:GNAT superfamily N-acetyltransferase